MLARAFQQMLTGLGLPNVRVDSLGDWKPNAAEPRSVAVHVESDGGEGLYRASLQIRARARTAVAAEQLARLAYDAVLARRYTVLEFVNPADDSRTTYDVRYIEATNRPTWFPTQTEGEVAVCNFTVFLRESP